MTTMAPNAVASDLLATMHTARTTSASTAADAQNRFMTLLVTQMKNQDPLNPLDNAQVTSQLAPAAHHLLQRRWREAQHSIVFLSILRIVPRSPECVPADPAD